MKTIRVNCLIVSRNWPIPVYLGKSSLSQIVMELRTIWEFQYIVKALRSHIIPKEYTVFQIAASIQKSILC